MRRGDEQVLDEVFFLGRRADAALAAAPLRAVERQRRALDVAAVGHGDDHVLVGDQVLDVDLATPRRRSRCGARRRTASADLAAARSTMISSTSFSEPRISLELRDQRQDLLVLRDDLLALEAGQALQAHVEDRLRLDLVEPQDLGALALRRRGEVCRGTSRARRASSRPRPIRRSLASSGSLEPRMILMTSSMFAARARGLAGCGRAPRPSSGRTACAG